MSVFTNYLFKMYRPGHCVFRYKSFWAWDMNEVMIKAGEWAGCNGYIDLELVKEDNE